MAKLKIWEIIPNLGGGGAERMLLELISGLDSDKFEVKLVSLYGPDWVTAKHLSMLADYSIDVRFLQKVKGFDPKVLYQLWRMIRKEKPDLIHTHLDAFNYVATIRKLERFRHIHTLHSIAGNEYWAHKTLLTHMCRTGQTDFVALTPYTAQTMRLNYPVDERRLHVIPNGIDLAKYPPIDRAPRNPMTFVTVGSLTEVKNQRGMISAFAAFLRRYGRQDKLIIVGEGVLRPQLEEQIQSLSLQNHVELVGSVKNVVDYLHQADAYVMFSRFEGVSLAILEAASTGLPLIVAATGGTPDVVGEDALLIEDNNEEQLVSAMFELAHDSACYRRKHLGAMAVAERYSLLAMQQAYTMLFQR